MSQIWKSIIIIIIMVVVVVGGVYFWQQNKEVKNQSAARQETKDQEVFKGSGFSFVYPSKYVADEKGLWTEEGYEWHLNPPETCSFCHTPYIAVKAEATNQTLTQYIITNLALPGNSLKEAFQQGGISYEEIKIGGREYIKITTDEMVLTTGYYLKNKNTVVSFQVFGEGQDENELKEIVGSLVFE
ncbi:MAG: hypothetical protein A2921_00655 [Candidatus Magasanikbacteria bacterium RIFCSPLOWO2_01_FULL_43_20b]|uniref:Uncharacterized protein n=1 Tax=Candidatus Magasanikbacteria bacterium RIFCSPLOWO2_12_FULL_43_12 TaxID=1798692 RepID=A0A1F6MVV9_9BACT|nr:MAG: hypothetical protein A3I93_01170 [Candidatus Magasanikbacteria bacterium RIFCSPLOWO2_02_FULL_43_22]OGH72133.1 MAG: hypothetical protein A3C74_04175 [Candidatus Magasanikbacteria bacterium RIFCSPHIGHO2_02_FULL_44_13]OGH72920.1 MAG: hypothetical protein A2921_00655 [Candidatus Magasanikbacteria bacterium RIFCSPLOWO2_01_FULL_43_20b]OGH75648.1 MAG: hypothetical protein A3G00_04095 [Candidatus Magasanikbacteria bacterium RIFCSPLOWO2_12_FULL_43_12]